MKEGAWLVQLTNSERMALIDLLIEFQQDPNATRDFVDVAAGKTTTPGDLIRRIDGSTWFSREKIIEFNLVAAMAAVNVED
ncbi:MAG TPA: hypothetical protein VKP58_08215 [Candidatus Acidoferrum sp.]|nr:hypothetical protein [Candidatus Acidoferrum sp.]